MMGYVGLHSFLGEKRALPATLEGTEHLLRWASIDMSTPTKCTPWSTWWGCDEDEGS